MERKIVDKNTEKELTRKNAKTPALWAADVIGINQDSEEEFKIREKESPKAAEEEAGKKKKSRQFSDNEFRDADDGRPDAVVDIYF
jgi:hypothetical protein